MDRIKIIATLKWVHDILRELHFTDVLEDIDDCIMMLKKEQREAVQHQWVGLTDDEVKSIISNLLEDDPTPLLTLADVIQERLREKNGG